MTDENKLRLINENVLTEYYEHIVQLETQLAAVKHRELEAVEAIQSVCEHCGFDADPCKHYGCFAYAWRPENMRGPAGPEGETP